MYLHSTQFHPTLVQFNRLWTNGGRTMDEKSKPKIEWTEAGIRALRPTGRREEWRDPETGMVLLMTPKGAKTFYLPYRPDGGRFSKKQWFKLGRFDRGCSLTNARKQCRIRQGEISNGKDPQKERKENRKAKTTVGELCDRFERDFLDAGKVKGSTAVGYKQHIKAHIRPTLGKLNVREVGPSHISNMLDGIPGKGQRDHVRRTASRLFSRAELWELRDKGTNPVAGQDRTTGSPREERMTPEEIQTLGAYLKGSGEPWQVLTSLVVLLCSGMRSSELAGNTAKKIPALPWNGKKGRVDLDEGVIRLFEHKTDNKIRVKVIYLCPQLVELLRKAPRENDLVLGGWKNLGKAWVRVRAAVKMGHITLHHFRHTFLSVGDDLGFSEPTRSALVGHKAKTQTGSYTHKLDRDLQEAAAKIGGHLWSLLGW